MSASDYVEERTRIDLEKLERDTAELQAKVIEAFNSGEKLPGWISKSPDPIACSPTLAAIWKRLRE